MKMIYAAILFTASLSQIQTLTQWELVKDKNGIQVYVSLPTDSEYYAFKAIMSVRTTEEHLLNILNDVNKYPAWFAFTASARRISQSGNTQFFLMETDYPWPYANECMNYEMVFEKIQRNKHKISITGMNQDVQCDYSLNKASGYILLEPENGRINITYYFHSEPSQNIPAWLINPMIHKMPYQTFMALKEKLNVPNE